ncbi:MAG: hypothetical protein KDA49_17325 [Rhodospirillaceae bacterium]|nr:hypothetical protein [Rhodospirillaceae bacterium]MCA8934243.1 hypothetical protein [Rhodospirillaceae bacterium]
MNKRSGVMVAGLCLVLAAGGCARNQDPSQAGFFSGVANLADGTYDQRVADREATRDRTVAQADQLAARAAELDQERRQLAVEEANALQRLQNLNGQIALEQARLAQLGQQQNVDRNQLSMLQTRASNLEQQRLQLQSAPPTQVNNQELDELQQEVDALRSVIDSMIEGLAVVE